MQEIDALRRRVAELDAPARRFKALVDGGIVSVQIYDPTAHTIEVNAAWERLWNLRIEDVAGWSLLDDANVRAGGFMDRIERAFYQGEAASMPTIRYDPTVIDTIKKGSARWVAANLHPVKDASGAVREVVMLHMDVGELTHTAEELRLQKEQLEIAVAERTADLERQLGLIEEQQRAIIELSTPVLRIWEGVLALPLIGRIDAARGASILQALLQRIVETGSDRVVMDITGVPFIDEVAARCLHDTVRAARLLGAHCAIVGISPATAGALVELDLGFEDVPTYSTLQEWLRRVVARSPVPEER
ncbi:MAG: STAS domain-containing protein [Polyangiaceae bacterium]|nr:STAS domain-containing protein [Polyangiaceae bacterium]